MSVMFTVPIQNAVIYSAWAGSIGNLWETNSESPIILMAALPYVAFHQVILQSDKFVCQLARPSTSSDCAQNHGLEFMAMAREIM